MSKKPYELWDMTDKFDQPMFLVKRFDDYMSAWTAFVERIKTTPCVIICNKNPQEMVKSIYENSDKYIYESPDGGKTVYRRKFGKERREKIS